MSALLQSDLENAQPIGVDAELWQNATPAQRMLMLRISKHRKRLKARSAAQAQAKALQAQAVRVQEVDPEAPFSERLVTFVRLHPMASAAAGAALLALGPRRLIRWSSIAMPWVLRWQQRRNR